MKIKKTKNHGKDCLRISFTIDGIHHRKFFPDTPEGWMQAEAFIDENQSALKKRWSLLSHHEKKALLDFNDLRKENALEMKIVRLALLRLAKANAPTVEVAVEEFINRKRAANRSQCYIKQLKYVLGQFAKKFGKALVSLITPAEIEDWVHSGKYAPGTRRGRFSDVRTFFEFAVRKEWVPSNPCLRLEPINVIRATPVILSVESSENLMLKAYEIDPGLCAWLALALFCGVRVSELQRISRAQIKHDGKYLDMEARFVKGTSKPRLIPLPENVRLWLTVPGQIAPKNLAKRLRRLVAASGLAEKWARNILRHSAASYHYALTENAGKTAKFLGHTEAVFHSSYHHPVSKEDAEKFYGITPPKYQI